MVAFLTEENVGQWFEGQYAAIPEHERRAMENYVLHGVAPGKFLTAVISNDLRNAVGYADETNLPLLKIYVQWFYNLAPMYSHGTLASLDNWAREGGLVGRKARQAAQEVTP